MDNQSIVFLEVMAGIAVVGVLAFLILLLARRSRRAAEEGAAGAGGQGAAAGPQWYETLLALALLAVIAVLVAWGVYADAGTGAGAGNGDWLGDWRGESRTLVFFIVMLVIGGVGLLGYLVYLFVRARQAEASPGGGPNSASASTSESASGDSAPTAAGHKSPPATRLLGLLILALAFLLLNWTYLGAGEQYAVMLYLIYPASLAVALVLLFDKASRTWSAKSGAESLREWLLCDAIVFLLILGFVNLMQSAAGDKYAAMIWDLIFVVLFFFTFWTVDRKLSRYRFLVAHIYLVLLPILLLFWRGSQGVAAPENLSWWGTVWPFFFLAIVSSVLEIIALMATRESGKSGIAAVKDALFLIVYGALLISAIPGGAE